MKYGFLICFAALLLSSCLKDKAFLDVSNTEPIIEFSYGSAGLAGLGNFATDATVIQLDTAISVNIASPEVLDYPVTVTVKIDTGYIGKFNAQGGLQLNALPDSNYSFTTTTVTIPAGHRIGRIPFTLYPSKIDPGPSYGFPISIVSATGPSGQNLLVSGNAGVAIYTFIGNPIAGAYEQEWIRWNATDTSGDPNFDIINPNTDPDPALFKPVDPTTIQIESGTGVVYNLSFKNNTGVLSDFKVSFTPASVASSGITITGGPIIERADPITGVYRFYFTYNNAAGAARVIVDNFTKQ